MKESVLHQWFVYRLMRKFERIEISAVPHWLAGQPQVLSSGLGNVVPIGLGRRSCHERSLLELQCHRTLASPRGPEEWFVIHYNVSGITQIAHARDLNLAYNTKRLPSSIVIRQ